MNKRLELDIKNINIIVHKSEEQNFKFYNPAREHDGFVMLTKGSAVVTLDLGKQIELECGDAFLVNAGTCYTIEARSECAYVTSALDLATDKTMLPNIYKCSPSCQKKILELSKIWQSRSWDSYAACRIGLLDFYFHIFKENISTERYDCDVSKAIEFIHDNFKRNFSSKELSEYCSMSQSYLRAKFIKQTGFTVVSYRDSLRIAAAKEMLESGYFTVTQIASELGYCDVYHFSKSFAAHEGLSPKKWLEN